MDYLGIKVLRCLLLKEVSAKKYEQLIKLESHLKKGPKIASKEICEFIHKRCNQKAFDTGAVNQMAGIVAINSFGTSDRLSLVDAPRLLYVTLFVGYFIPLLSPTKYVYHRCDKFVQNSAIYLLSFLDRKRDITFCQFSWSFCTAYKYTSTTLWGWRGLYKIRGIFLEPLLEKHLCTENVSSFYCYVLLLVTSY